MTASSTFDGRSPLPWLEMAAGIGMMAFSGLTVQHFLAANYPTSIFEGSFCEINAFFNCDSWPMPTASGRRPP